MTELANDLTKFSAHDCTDGRRYPLRRTALNEKQDQRCQKTDLARIETKVRPCFQRFTAKLKLFHSTLDRDCSEVGSIKEIAKNVEKTDRLEPMIEDTDERASQDNIRSTLEPEQIIREIERLDHALEQYKRRSQSKAGMDCRDSVACVDWPSYQNLLAQEPTLQQSNSLRVAATPQSSKATPSDPLVHPTVNSHSMGKTTPAKNLVPLTYSYTALRYPPAHIENPEDIPNECAGIQQPRSSSHTTGLSPLATPFVSGSNLEAPPTLEQNSSTRPNVVTEQPSGGRRKTRRRRTKSTLA